MDRNKPALTLLAAALAACLATGAEAQTAPAEPAGSADGKAASCDQARKRAGQCSFCKNKSRAVG